MVYQFRENFFLPVDAQTVGDRLDLLVNKNHGSISPEIVLQDAEPKDAPLHSAFEWDDTVAARRHRLDHARYILRSVEKVEIEIINLHHGQPPKTITTTIRAFHPVREDNKPVYKTIGQIMNDSELRAQLLGEAKAKLVLWKENYKNLKELAEVYAAIDHVVTIKKPQAKAAKTKKKAA